MTLAHRKQALESLARRKSRELLENYPIMALALTGSLARDTVWVGSDLDFWGFAGEAETDFIDGVEDGIYWEIDIAPAETLDLEIERDTWLNPPAFRDDEVVSHFEALYGCRIIHDPDGKLSRLRTAIDDRMADPTWLHERATRFLTYAIGVLDALQLAPPVEAILYAREVATNYGIGAFWMFRQSLLTSAIRIPERLTDVPEIHRLYCQIFALDGQASLDTFMTVFAVLPAEIQQNLHSDVYNEALPAAKLGAVNGALRYLRLLMMERALEYGLLEQVYPCLGLDADVEAQRDRVLEQCRRLISIVGEEA